jgi:hypothetical protein
MTLHSGSSVLAHNLDRFNFCSDFELVAAEAARLNVAPGTVRFYRDRYGDETVSVIIKGTASRMPVYEFQIRRWILGERIQLVSQVANVAA